MTTRDAVFISYCHKDTELMEELKTHLTPLATRGMINYWVDAQHIETGEAWRAEIDKGLARTKVAVMLVSKHFLASEFIMNVEVPYFLEAHQKDGVKLYQVVIGRCCHGLFKELSRFQALNKPEHPLMGMEEVKRDEVWVDLTHKIVRALSQDAKPKEAAPEPAADRKGAARKQIATMVGELKVVVGDIAEQRQDAIVISAGSRLRGDEGGMEQHVHRRAGEGLRGALEGKGPLAYGQAVITDGCRLPARHVIHTVAPWWVRGNTDERVTLAAAYRAALALARQNELRTLAVPLLGMGAKGVPREIAVKTALTELASYLATAPAKTAITVVCFDEADKQEVERIQQELARGAS